MCYILGDLGEKLSIEGNWCIPTKITLFLVPKLICLIKINSHEIILIAPKLTSLSGIVSLFNMGVELFLLKEIKARINPSGRLLCS